ncbi:NAD-aldehyde dehydrogenase [Auriculariales sp. MPI-PUGE-AT-0066]|nr:NAD-aldehyde dehydrogenase [Auriculariales sp. MPI-PUGE-AT-0066]
MAALSATVQILKRARPLTVPTGLFINNQFVASSDGSTIRAINPATEETICDVQSASRTDIDLAVKAARDAFRTTWGRNITPTERSRLMNKLAELMERDQQDLADLETLNNGKPNRFARDSDIGDSIACLRYFAGWTDKDGGQVIEQNDTQRLCFTKHEPVGVCGQIIPWNYPIMMWAWKTAPALATGCTVVMKPSELTPLTALKLCELVAEAGFPPGVVNCVPSLGNVGGAALAEHPDVDKVAFTGSTAVGRKIMQAAANNLKKISLELGGKSPSIIFESVDLDQAAAWSAFGILWNSGQDCTAGSRLYVHENIYDKFLEILIQKASQFKVGDGFTDDASGGPLISKTQYDKVWNYIEEGKKAGAKVVIGGEKIPGPGYYVPPTIFVDVKPDMKIVKEEIFGPVLCVQKFSTEEEAIALANDTIYGLAAAVHSNDQAQLHRVSNALQAGTIWINSYCMLYNSVPFGGYKQSGIGRELGSYALREYTNVKAVHWNFAEKLDWPL